MVMPSGDIILVSKVDEGETPVMYKITANTINESGNANLKNGIPFYNFHFDHVYILHYMDTVFIHHELQ